MRAQAAARVPARVLRRRPGAPAPASRPARFCPCRNIQDELHARIPQRHPRDARTAYFIDPKDLLAIGRLRGARATGSPTIYHSHVDAGAYFSDRPTGRTP